MADQTDQIENTYRCLQDHINKLYISQNSIITKFDILSKNVDELRRILNQFSDKIACFDELVTDKRKINTDFKLLKGRVDELFTIVKEGKDEESARSDDVQDIDSCHSGFSCSSKVI